jgi:hypothetical protein
LPAVRKRPLAAALKLGTPVNPSSKQAKSDYSVRGTSIPYSKRAISDYGVRNAAISQIRNGAERQYHRQNVRHYGENKTRINGFASH